MLRASIWATRLVGLIVVGLLIFLHPATVPGGAATQQLAFAGLCVGELLLALSETELPPERTGRLLRSGSLLLIVAAACLGASAAGNGTYMIIFAVSGIQAAVADLSLTTALAIAALGTLVSEIGGIAFDEGIGTFGGFPLLLIVGMMLGRSRADYRIRAEQAAALLEQHQRLRVEQRRADVLDERARLAREIHDVLAHSLGALGIQIQVARALISDRGDTDGALDALEKAQRMASEGLVETRRAVHALRADTLPLHEELARAAAEHAERRHVLVHCDIQGEPRPVPPDATVALLRTAQESLVNAAKHAPAAEVEMRLVYTPHAVRLAIANDLPTAAAPAMPDADPAMADADPAAHAPRPGPVPMLQTVNGGYGLTGMRERLKLLRGTLDAGVVGDRWIVAADLPLES
ncbi:sensor histidine kinase [Actinospica sp.]|jgi:signal transduction histidine kinase|uniref:sensor histidine kinase n=1 Tax=Actinospica sp. TaxID=1872142 RepID=UPI002C8A2B2A|nr:histidine kinase [Actinospica sp.]HWG28111.1 histidine kinase [Actinospica sp.]